MWQPWEERGDATSGNFYLTTDVTLEATITFTASEKLNICLNGYTITGASGVRVFEKTKGSTQAILSICDCSEKQSGKVVSMGKEVAGMLRSATLNLYGGTLTLDKSVTANGDSRIVRLGNSSYVGVFNMYGGKLTGGKTTSTGAGVSVGTSGSKFYMYGGEISGNQSTNNNGGGVYVVAGGIFQVSGDAVITGNYGKGNIDSNVYLLTGASMTVKNLGENASIGLMGTEGVVGTADKDPAGKIFSDDPQFEIAWVEENKELRLQAKVVNPDEEGA